jgi:type VI secretion system protein ImpK
MTPEFAEAIDPIFVRMLRLLERIGRGEDPSPEEERVAVCGYLTQAEGRMGQRPDWALAKYAVVAWIDEVLIEAPWQGRTWWVENTLEWEEFKTAECSEQFYVKAQEATALSNRDALEVFYVCVILGFRGLYRDPVPAEALAESLGLPSTLEAWAQRKAAEIRLGSGRAPVAEPGKKGEVAAPLDGPYMLVWSSFLAVILLFAASIVAWMVFFPPS